MSYMRNLRELGNAILGRTVTQTLYVSPNGAGTDGLTLATAHTEIQDALDAASTDANDCTLIMISPHATYYDINTTGSPLWTGNYILAGTHRDWTKIMNNHGSANRIFYFTGKVALLNLNFNLGTGKQGVNLEHDGFRVYKCQFIGQDLTSTKVALSLQGSFGKVIDCDFHGEGKTQMTAMSLYQCARSDFEKLRIHDCKIGFSIFHTATDKNIFTDIMIHDSGIGFDIDEGNEQMLDKIDFHGNTTNIDDEVGDHHYDDIRVESPMIFLPDDFVGVNLDTHANPDTWGTNTEILAGIFFPFKVVGISVEADATEKFRIRLSADSGSTHFVDFQVEGTANINKRVSIQLPTATDFIFNRVTRISGSSKSESGNNTMTVWLEVQVI